MRVRGDKMCQPVPTARAPVVWVIMIMARVGVAVVMVIVMVVLRVSVIVVIVHDRSVCPDGLFPGQADPTSGPARPPTVARYAWKLARISR
jgi:hypothetical protein